MNDEKPGISWMLAGLAISAWSGAVVSGVITAISVLRWWC